jgi:hypothetical protein
MDDPPTLSISTVHAQNGESNREPSAIAITEEQFDLRGSFLQSSDASSSHVNVSQGEEFCFGMVLNKPYITFSYLVLIDAD